MKCFKCKTKCYRKDKYCMECGNNLKKQRRIKKLVIFILIILLSLVIINVNKFIQNNFNNQKIIITNLKSISKNGDKLFVLDDKTKIIKGKINTFKKIESGYIEIYNGKSVIYETELTKKSFMIDTSKLSRGLNQITIKYTLKDKELKQIYYIVSNNENNLKDTDDDKVIDIIEKNYNTDINSSDTDQDGLTDYEEIYITLTDPTKQKTYYNIDDKLYDTDGDGISNIDEIKSGTNPVIRDTDHDGLTDKKEIELGTNPKSSDTDSDTLSDYDEVNIYKTNPKEKTSELTGNISSVPNVVLKVGTINIKDMDKIEIVEGQYSILNNRLGGYILPPYKINTKLSINPIIGFDLNNIKLKPNSIPTIYEIDKEKQTYREVECNYDNGVIYTTVYDLNKLYMLFDKNYLNNVQNTVDTSSETVTLEHSEENIYLMLDSPLAHVLSTFFGAKMPSLKVYCYGDCDAKNHIEIEKTIEKELNYTVDIEFVKINKIRYNITKIIISNTMNLIRKIVSGFLGDEVANQNIKNIKVLNSNSKAQTAFNVVESFEFYGLPDLENYFLNEDLKRLSSKIKTEVSLRDNKDSNNDGITDGMTQLIINGMITTKEGYNPFEGLTLKQINKNNDYDNDGIINGNEIKVVEYNGKYILEMTSDPTKKDSDEDGIKDKDDPKPLVSFDSRFKFRDSLKGEPSNLYKLKDEVDKYNSLFNTGRIIVDGKYVEKNSKEYIEILLNKGHYSDIKIEYVDTDGVTKYTNYNEDKEGYSMILMASEVGKINIGPIQTLPDAANAEDKYWKADGTPFTEEDVSDRLIEAEDIQRYLNKEIDMYISLAKNAVASGKTMIFEKKEMGTSTKAYGGSVDKMLDNMNSIMFLHYASNNSIAEISNENGFYRIKLRYFIEDIYDWKKEPIEGDSTSQIEVMYFNQLLLGNAKVYLVHIEYDVNIEYDSKTGKKNIMILDRPIYKR